jgi:SAM-dependent methyltransferase
MQNVLIKKVRNWVFPGSASYWEKRYRKNGNSGVGSYGRNAAYKAGVLNEFVRNNNIKSVLELGCGDGNQAMQFDFPGYTGLDISPTAIKKCLDRYKGDPAKQFFISGENTNGLKAELALSLDVIYHLVEKEVYENYMKQLFAAATRYVIIYAWNVESEANYHVRHRKFSGWVKNNVSDFTLLNKIENSNFSDFYIYQRVGLH